VDNYEGEKMRTWSAMYERGYWDGDSVTPELKSEEDKAEWRRGVHDGQTDKFSNTGLSLHRLYFFLNKEGAECGE
jgi:hypothetical protein